MSLGLETVKFIDGSEKEISMGIVVITKIKELKSKYLKIHKVTPDGNSGIKTMEGNFDYEMLSLEIVKGGIAPVKIDDLDPNECDRLYNKYYARYVNPQTSKEEKKS